MPPAPPCPLISVRPLISAHRGGAEDAPPGTYEAYEQAAATGAEYAELDIRRTRDGTLVVHHDARVRPAGAAGPAARLAGLDYPELCAAAGYRVPRAAGVMTLLSRAGVAGHLDLKETGYEAAVIEQALTSFGPGRFVATTLEDASVSAIKAAFSQVTTALSLGRDLTEVAPRKWPGVRAGELAPLARVRRCGADWVAVNHRLARLGVTRACARAGVGVMVWTVDGDRAVDGFLRDRRLEMLVTSRPRYAAARRAELASQGAPAG